MGESYSQFDCPSSAYSWREGGSSSHWSLLNFQPLLPDLKSIIRFLALAPASQKGAQSACLEPAAGSLPWNGWQRISSKQHSTQIEGRHNAANIHNYHVSSRLHHLHRGADQAARAANRLRPMGIAIHDPRIRRTVP